MYQEATLFAQKLSSIGIQPGMRIAILASSNQELMFALHGCMQLGCELVMLNERLTEEELNYQLADSQADYLLVDSHEKRNLASTKVFPLRMFMQLYQRN